MGKSINKASIKKPSFTNLISSTQKTTTHKEWKNSKRKEWLSKIKEKSKKPAKSIAKPSLPDLSSLNDALLDFSSNPAADDTNSKKDTVKPKPVKQSARRKANNEEIIRMQQIFKHDQFKANPLSTIQLHLQNSIK